MMTDAAVILKKELREMLRDRRVVVGAFVMPILVVFMMTRLFGTISSSLGDKKTTRIGVVAAPSSSPLADAFAKTPELAVTRMADEAEARAKLEKGDVKAVLLLPEIDMGSGKQVEIRALFQSDETTSQIAVSKAERWVSEANKAALQQVLEQKGIPKEAAEAMKVKREDTAKAKGAGDSMLVSLLPYLMILFMFSGGMSIASDLVAGEKERGTLETLLISPISRSSIALGKFGALLLFSMSTGLMSVAALFGLGYADPSARKMMFANGLTVGPTQIVMFLVLVLTLATFFASLLLAISTYARNMREAQTFMAVANFLVIMPAVFSQIIGFTDAGRQLWVRLTPILNTAVGMREIMLGKATTIGIAAPALMSLAMAAILAFVAMHLFQNEKVLSRTG